jgi:hypothetical protein
MMRISRFYTPSTLQVDDEIELDAQLSHYINNVLRLKQADPIVLFNGDGNEYSASHHYIFTWLKGYQRVTEWILHYKNRWNLGCPK